MTGKIPFPAIGSRITPTLSFPGDVDEAAIYNRALEPGEILAHFNAGDARTDLCGGSAAPTNSELYAPYPDDTISLWPLDEGAGSTLFVDVFDDNDGEVAMGNTAPTAVGGRVVGAQSFAATGTGIDVPANSAFNWTGTESFSIEFWLNTPVLPTTENEIVVGRYDAVTGLQLWVGLSGRLPDSDDGKVQFTFGNTASGFTNVRGDTVLTANTWYHVVVVRDGDDSLIYLNGSPDRTSPDTTPFAAGFGSGTAPLTIGDFGFPGDFDFNGSVDEVALYNRALAPDEIKAHFDAGQLGNGVGTLRPDANVGADQVVTEGDTVTLDGSTSTGANVTYLWEPVGNSVMLTNASSDKATFTAPSVGTSGETLTFRLTVTDSFGQTAIATTNVTVNDSSTPVTPPVTPSGGGGGGGGCFISTMF